MKYFTLFVAVLISGTVCFAQNNNTNVNNNSTTVIINNKPVVKETVVKTKTRVVYKDPPKTKPKRQAMKLPAPVQIQGYLWVYTEDLGYYSELPTSVIENINKQKKYGRDNWRVPTDEELTLMQNEWIRLGLGEGVDYAYIYGRNNIFGHGNLRLVSTGLSIAEKQKAEEERRKQEETEAEARRKQIQESLDARERERQEEQLAEIRAGRAFVQGNLLWQTRNMDAKRDTDPGVITGQVNLTDGWRLPTVKEFRSLINNSTESPSGYRYGQNIIPYGTYLVNDNGTTKTYNVKLDMVLDGKSGLLRAVK